MPCVIDEKPTSKKYLDGNLNNLSCTTAIHNGCKSLSIVLHCIVQYVLSMGKDIVKVMLLYTCSTMTICVCLSVYLYLVLFVPKDPMTWD